MILIRADGNKKVGTGHVMRCMSLAKKLRQFGKEIIFVTADNEVKSLIEDNGFFHISLDSDYEKLEDEIEKIETVIDEYNPSAVVVDSYFATARYLESIHKKVRVAYFDAKCKKVLPIDCLINYNIFSDIDKCKILYRGKATKLLVGMHYALLRDEFIGVPDKDVSEKASRVLVLTGGADSEHIALRFVENIAKREINVNFDIVAGALSGDIQALKQAQDSLSNVRVHVNIKNIHELMQNADIAVAAAGGTAYELCACGTPMVVYTFADNQLKAAECLDEKGAAINVGDLRDNENFFEKVRADMLALLCDYKARCDMSAKAKSLCDGRGAERLARALFE